MRVIVFASAVLTLSASFTADPACGAARKPNIILIVSDDQGYRDLGCYGSREVKTPHLDSLAAQGVRLTDFYVSWPACTPSRGSILTGRYPQRNGLYDMIRNDVADFGKRMDDFEYAVSPEMTLGLDVREVTIAQALRAAGYTSAIFGKWDSGRARRFLPLQRGFDDFFGFANTGIDYWTHERYGIPSLFRNNDRILAKGFATDLFRDEAIAFIQRNKDRPFFLYLAFNAPHAASNLSRPGVQAPPEAFGRYPERDPKDRRTAYLACISNMDDAIGTLLGTLRTLGLEKETLVLFHSDNGGSGGVADNGVLRGGKGQMFDGGLRVPFLARWPGRIKAGRVCSDFVSALELFPSILAAAGAPVPAGVVLDGFDVLPVLEGKARSKRTEMFWERRADKAARVGHYKWVHSAKGKGLYDLSADPGESRDLAAERPELLNRLQLRWLAWKAEMEASEPRGPFRDY